MVIIYDGKWKLGNHNFGYHGAKVRNNNPYNFYTGYNSYSSLLENLRRIYMKISDILLEINRRSGMKFTISDFKRWFNRLMKEEGGYANHKSDSGGETFMGFTRKNHSTLGIWKEIDEVKQPFLHDLHANRKKIDDLMKPRLKDSYVIEMLEASSKYFYPLTSIKSYNCKSSQIEDLLIGLFFFSFNAGPKRVYEVTPGGVLDETVVQRVRLYYVNLIEAKPRNEVFRKGWSHRLSVSFNRHIAI